MNTAGVVPACRSLDCVSVFTTDLDDAANVLNILAGPGPPMIAHPTRRVRRSGTASSPCRHGEFAVPERYPPPAGAGRDGELDLAGNDALAAVFDRVADGAAQRAEVVVRIPLAPLLEAGDLLYGSPWVAEPVARNFVLGRYTQFANLLDLAAVAVPAGTTPDGRLVSVCMLGSAFSMLGPGFLRGPPAVLRPRVDH